MNDTFHSYAYDAEGRLLTVDGGATASYLYDALGRRVESTTASNKIDFIYDQTGRAITQATASSWARSELYAGSLHVATYASSTTFFDHSDWLGTVRALSMVSGSLYQGCSSLPFGDSFSCTGSPWYPLQFTGDEHDNESNLEHTLFRQYTSTQGRWISPDPAGLAAVDPSDPQTWNRYAYVGNRPISHVDPLGLDGECDPDLDPFFCPCDFDPFFCDPFGPPGPPFGAGSPPPLRPPTRDQFPRSGGVWPDNETLGLPPGINFKSLTLGDLFGLNPNGPCDFGVCAPVGMGAVDGSAGSGGFHEISLSDFAVGLPIDFNNFCKQACKVTAQVCKAASTVTGWWQKLAGFWPGDGIGPGRSAGSRDGCGLGNRFG